MAATEGPHPVVGADRAAAGEPPIDDPQPGEQPDGGDTARWRRVAARLRPSPLGLGVALLALAVRLQTAGHGIVTNDEPSWLARSATFYQAVTEGRFGHATVPIDGFPKTRPGVTTMWIGSVSRFLTLTFHRLGWSDSITTPFEQSPLGLRIAQLITAVICAVLIGLLAVMVARLLGRRAGLIAGVLVAVEPFVVAHTVVLHPEGILTLTMVMAGLALLLALRFGVDDDPAAPLHRGWLMACGVLAGLAVLSKISALGYLVAFVVPVVVHLVRRHRLGTDARASLLDLGRGAGLALGALVVTMLVIWPALWADGLDQIEAVIQSARLGEAGHNTFFRGTPTPDPGPTYYLVAIPLRASPWVLFGGFAGLVTSLLLRHRNVRGRGLAVALVAVMPLPFLLVVSLADKQFDRYGLPVIVTLAVLAAVALDDLLTLAAARDPFFAQNETSDRTFHAKNRRAVRWGVAAVAVVLVALPVVRISPYPLAYFNPVLGGAEQGERMLLVGWGEGQEAIGRKIIEDRGGDCEGVVTAVPSIRAYIAFPCGTLIPLRSRVYRNLSDVTYAVNYISDDQRRARAPYFDLVAQQGTRIMTLRINGLVYAELWRIDRPPPGECANDLMAVPYVIRCGGDLRTPSEPG